MMVRRVTSRPGVLKQGIVTTMHIDLTQNTVTKLRGSVKQERIKPDRVLHQKTVTHQFTNPSVI